MDEVLLEFVEVLRQNGIKVSAAEATEALLASTHVGLLPKAAFRSALRSTLAKRLGDQETFERAFDLHFSGASQTLKAIDASLAQRLQEEGLLSGDELAMVVATVDRLFNQLSPLAQATLRGDRGRLAQLFRGAMLQLDLRSIESPLQVGFFSRRMLSLAGAERASSDLSAIEQELKARGLSSEGLTIVSTELGRAMRRVEEAARKELGRAQRSRSRKSGEGILERPFESLTRAEIEQAQSAVRRLAERLKSRLVKRQKSRRRGALHVRRTLRRNLSWGGIPMVPKFKSRRPHRPEVLVLCDVSDSVRNASRMMLLFTHQLQSIFLRVRSFVFVSEIGEVTSHFKSSSPEEAIEMALSGEAVPLQANSNYGNALLGFWRGHGAQITRKSTVVIIGDGRNNFNPNNAWVLREIKARCRRLLWICTEDTPAWGLGDSEMATYSKLCHQAVVVRSLTDLGQVAMRLV